MKSGSKSCAVSKGGKKALYSAGMSVGITKKTKKGKKERSGIK